jgi:hypothetical protein
MRRARFIGLCAIGSKTSPAQAVATLLAGPAHGQGWLSKPGYCRGSGQVIRWRAALARQQRSRARAKQFSLPARACAATPSIAAVRLRFCQIARVQRQNAGEFRNRRGEGLFIARRFASAVYLVVYKVRQFGGNYLQSAARQELLDKSSVYGKRRDLGRLTSTGVHPSGEEMKCVN